MFTNQYWFTKKWVLYDMKPNVAKHFNCYPSNMKHSFGVHVLVLKINIYILIFKYVLQTFDKRKFVRQQFDGSRGDSWTYPAITTVFFEIWKLHDSCTSQKTYENLTILFVQMTWGNPTLSLWSKNPCCKSVMLTFLQTFATKAFSFIKKTTHVQNLNFY